MSSGWAIRILVISAQDISESLDEMDDSREESVSYLDESVEMARLESEVWFVSDGSGIICALYFYIGDLSLA